MHTAWNKSGIFYQTSKETIIENLVLEIRMNNKIERNLTAGLISNNYGIIRNIQIRLTESTELKNTDAYLCVTSNYGIIENFIVNLKVSFYANAQSSLLCGTNKGIIKNGYAYGENIKNLNETSNVTSLLSGIATNNYENAQIKNVFSLVNIDNLYNGSRFNGNILAHNYDNSTVQNVYSVGSGKNTNLNHGPNVYSKTSKKVYNNYYFADEIFTSELETKGNKLSLWDAQFQNQLINEEGNFRVDELVNEGYYPQLNMPDCMPVQDYIELPEVKDADLPDILSTKVLEQGTDKVKVSFSVNNPSSEQISKIEIANLDVEILSQDYKYGKSTVIAELKNPAICVSSYNVMSLSTKGAFGSGYTRTYTEGERVINVDLYKEIWNINDWKEMNNSPTENYMLMSDLNFVNEGNTISIANVYGTINGNDHTISNVNLTGPYDYGLLRHVYGTLTNLNINNFDQMAISNGGLISRCESGSLVDNVHMTDVQITKTGDYGAGGISHDTYYATIRNCSVDNIKINTQGDLGYVYIGGIAGDINNTYIENCFVQGLEINDTKGVNSGIGGIVGHTSGSNSIKNCYTEGIIKSVNVNVGGIAGNIVTTTIENCYTKLQISTTNNNVGGIVGLTDDIVNIANNVSIGDIYTTSGLGALNRIAGSSVETADSNYAYEKQLLNGYTREEKKGATLLNKEEVLNLDLGNNYNYDGKTEDILPKLYNTEGTELIPGQKNIFIDVNESEDVDLKVENIETRKLNSTEAEITIRINNPEEIEITDLQIEDINIGEITRNVIQNGTTSITVKATPIRYYDSYRLIGIKYKTNNSQESIKEVENEIQVQFYKEIYTYEDWQSIEEGTYQNYRLMADIDFSGRTNIKHNITVNRLEAENNVYTLKNIELSYNIANTGFINNIKTSIKNIGFENITLTNTAGLGNYFGVITSNNGDIENLKFKDITINAKGMNYIGSIGGMTSGNIKNVQVENITINANSYIGGFIGYVNLKNEKEIKQILASNINIQASSSNVGGIFGYIYLDYIDVTNLQVNNSTISGGTSTGGVMGYGYFGNLTYIKLENSEVFGTSNVAGIAGYLGDDSKNLAKRQFLEVKLSDIVGNGNYIGGIAGNYQRGSSSYWNVDNCNITQNLINGTGTGGLLGVANFAYPSIVQVVDTIIDSKGTAVGGLIGRNYTNTDVGVAYCYVDGTSINGASYVGGAYGYLGYGGINHGYINADILSQNNYAGGVVGYMDNVDMTASRNAIDITYTMVLDTKVTAPTKAGGLIGDITKNIYRDSSFYYNNYIDADVTSTNASTGSLIIGGRQEENPYVTNTYVYKYSKLNGNYVYATNDNIDDDQYLVRTDLNNQNTFQSKIGLGTTHWNYESLAEGKYPKIKNNYVYKPELQTGVDLPTDPEITEINLLNENNITTQNIQHNIAEENIIALLDCKIYPISVDEINVDFSGVVNDYNTEVHTKIANEQQGEQSSEYQNSLTNFTYYINGQEQETVELSNSTNQTYTFKYNFKDTIEIKLSNRQEEKTITITPEDVRSEASLVGGNNAYLLGSNLYINGELQQSEYVNVYEGKALRKDGTVINIATGENVENTSANSSNNANSSQNYLEQDKETYLEQTPKPLNTYEYKGNTIEVYGTYSKINGNIKLQVYNVRSGKLSALSNSLDMKIGNSITDNYNNKEYQTILNTSGELVDLKEMLKYPDNFLTRNIKQIVQNIDEEKTEVMVLYNTGKVIVFNYVSGEGIYETNENADEGLTDYITGSIENIWNDYEEKRQEYAKSKELEQKLAELPIEKAINTNGNGNTTNEITPTIDNDYITIYNAETGKYEVYSENEILKGSEEIPVSETEKIEQNGLEGIYGYNAKEEIKPQTNGAIIVVSIIAIAIIALVLLRRLVLKNNIKKKR